MPKVSVCIEMVCSEVDFCERPAMAARAGYNAVEIWGFGNKDLATLKAACDEAGVVLACSGALPGVNLVEAQPSDKVVGTMKSSAAAAEQFGTEVLLVTTGNELEGVSRDQQMDNIVEGLKAAAPVAEDAGLKLALEPLNTLVDHAGYFLDSTADGRVIVERVGSPAVGLLYDVYHMQIMEGNLIETIRANVDIIYHVHVADVPGRHEPGTGEINYANVFKALDECGYTGFCGLEFKPVADSEAALKRTREACGLA